MEETMPAAEVVLFSAERLLSGKIWRTVPSLFWR